MIKGAAEALRAFQPPAIIRKMSMGQNLNFSVNGDKHILYQPLAFCKKAVEGVTARKCFLNG